ncbi:MAG: hypothetical protein AABX70_07755 [Nanoarchaeota archaeon]
MAENVEYVGTVHDLIANEQNGYVIQLDVQKKEAQHGEERFRIALITTSEKGDVIPLGLPGELMQDILGRLHLQEDYYPKDKDRNKWESLMKQALQDHKRELVGKRVRIMISNE